MTIPEVITADGEKYVRDARYENRLDSVVQHMLAVKFTKEEIVHMIRVPESFIEEVCHLDEKVKK